MPPFTQRRPERRAPEESMISLPREAEEQLRRLARMFDIDENHLIHAVTHVSIRPGGFDGTGVGIIRDSQLDHGDTLAQQFATHLANDVLTTAFNGITLSDYRAGNAQPDFSLDVLAAAAVGYARTHWSIQVGNLSRDTHTEDIPRPVERLPNNRIERRTQRMLNRIAEQHGVDPERLSESFLMYHAIAQATNRELARAALVNLTQGDRQLQALTVACVGNTRIRPLRGSNNYEFYILSRDLTEINTDFDLIRVPVRVEALDTQLRDRTVTRDEQTRRVARITLTNNRGESETYVLRNSGIREGMTIEDVIRDDRTRIVRASDNVIVIPENRGRLTIRAEFLNLYRQDNPVSQAPRRAYRPIDEVSRRDALSARPARASEWAYIPFNAASGDRYYLRITPEMARTLRTGLGSGERVYPSSARLTTWLRSGSYEIFEDPEGRNQVTPHMARTIRRNIAPRGRRRRR